MRGISVQKAPVDKVNDVNYASGFKFPDTHYWYLCTGYTAVLVSGKVPDVHFRSKNKVKVLFNQIHNVLSQRCCSEWQLKSRNGNVTAKKNTLRSYNFNHN